MSLTAMEEQRDKSETRELQSYASNFLRVKHLSEKDISYRVFLQDKLLVTRAVRKGVTNVLFKEIKSNSPFDDQQWSNFLHINLRTLQRYKTTKDHVFKPIQSEKIFELAEVINTGYEVFDNPEDFNIWLNSPSVALGNEKPIDLLDSSYGKDLVVSELNRIEHGIFV